MKYFARKFGEDQVEEISKEKAKWLLEGFYKKKAVKQIFDRDMGFRIQTPWREIWTKTDDGMVPMAGFIGVCGDLEE